MMSCSNPTEDYDLINLVCPEGLEGHVRCLLGLAGGVKNLQVRNQSLVHSMFLCYGGKVGQMSSSFLRVGNCPT